MGIAISIQRKPPCVKGGFNDMANFIWSIWGAQKTIFHYSQITVNIDRLLYYISPSGGSASTRESLISFRRRKPFFSRTLLMILVVSSD